MLASIASLVTMPLSHDVTQVVLLVGCVFAGWLAWSWLLRLLEPTPQLIAKQKAITNKSDETPSTNIGSMSNSSSSEFAQRKPCIDLGRALLEDYGVFDSVPGVWTGTSFLPAKWCMDEDKDSVSM